MPRDSKLDIAFCGSTANLKESNIHYHERMTYSLMTAKNQAWNHLQKHVQFYRCVWLKIPKVNTSSTGPSVLLCECLTNTNNTNN